MTRPIKFRAWRDGSKMMLYGIERISMEDGEPISISDIPNLMQFTNLHDKNGVEIYEGDIVKVGVDRVYEVAWGENEFEGYYGCTGIILKDAHEESTGQHDVKKWEVIGNIYENPELIK